MLKMDGPKLYINIEREKEKKYFPCSALHYKKMPDLAEQV